MVLNELTVDFASPVPVYEQIKRQIKQAIAIRKLAEGEDLPSIRELAAFLKINPNTVARTYRDLVFEKIIQGRPGRGFWVEKSGDWKAEKEQMVREEFLKFLEKAVELGFSQDYLKKMVTDFFQQEKSQE